MLALALSGPARAATNVERQLEPLAVALEQLGRADEARRFREAVAATPPQDLEAVHGETDLTPLAEKLIEAAPLEAEVQAALAVSRATTLARANAAMVQTPRPPESILSHGNGPLPEAPWPDISGDFCDAQEIPGKTTSDTHEGFVKSQVGRLLAAVPATCSSSWRPWCLARAPTASSITARSPLAAGLPLAPPAPLPARQPSWLRAD